MLSSSVLLIRVASTNWTNTKNLDDDQLKACLKSYDSGKKAGYEEGISAALEVFRKNPEIFKPDPPSLLKDKTFDDILPKTLPYTNRS